MSSISPFVFLNATVNIFMQNLTDIRNVDCSQCQFSVRMCVHFISVIILIRANFRIGYENQRIKLFGFKWAYNLSWPTENAEFWMDVWPNQFIQFNAHEMSMHYQGNRPAGDLNSTFMYGTYAFVMRFRFDNDFEHKMPTTTNRMKSNGKRIAWNSNLLTVR